jgi:transcriptional regulator with XRE-family HTH domain
MMFGKKLKKIRKENGISQQELAKKLGYVNNSYISDVENGIFVPSKKKLKKIAKTLKVSFAQIKDLLREVQLEELGIKEPELINLFRDLPKLTKKEKNKIIEVYKKIKKI